MDPRFGFGQPLHPPQPNCNVFGFPFDTGDPNTCPGFGDPYLVGYNALEDVALFPVSGFQQSRASEPNDSLGWFSQTPHFHHAFAPELNSPFKEKLSMGAFDFGQQRSPTTGTVPAQKRFLVFDHSGDKTTLIYTSGVETPVQLGASLAPNPSTANNLWNKNPWDGTFHLGPIPADEKVEDNSRDILGDEVHEDTEELNALLCSDTEFSEDDEETSTGHSPSTMTDNHAHDSVEEIGEEVNSFTGPTKRRKLHDGGYDIISNSHTTSPLKTQALSSLDYDAESSCGDGNEHCKDKLISLSGGKRSKKEKIRETLSILQSIIPSAEGKDAIDVIDEAIHYLRSLKVKAKALGLNTL